MRWSGWRPGAKLAIHNPGIFFLGGDGSRDIWCTDLRKPEVGVLLTDIASSGWSDAEALGLTVPEFIADIDNGTFVPHPPLES